MPPESRCRSWHIVEGGDRITHSEILSLIGAGGMGQVYRARDTRLGRDVAIEVLPAEFASGPDRLRRFEQEARAVGALDHPNILALYDAGTHEGLLALILLQFVASDCVTMTFTPTPPPGSQGSHLPRHLRLP